ncbi:DUF523 domain-containing protein [Lysinibacillus telephonicus]|uniref:DUF523 domain-containing protein n=1 Tax=Lysinibacillus telephonicus TaxID=1714840 RepID=A0A3S0HVM0_9BACI|nr:DUF523 domain-containing protein [Lysinibacillus telephonicus]RTQ88619.1 DUF523 domain-containing protein [Lysinibacillus telephonicus]
MILVSSCLAGNPVRYNGTSCLNDRIQKLIDENKAIPVCPELLGGFVTPREPAEILGGDGFDVISGKAKVMERSGNDVTELYISGAKKTLALAKEMNSTYVVLKEYSPSCGSKKIYNGKFIGEKRAGVGVTTALLEMNGIKVISEQELEELLD